MGGSSIVCKCEWDAEKENACVLRGQEWETGVVLLCKQFSICM